MFYKTRFLLSSLLLCSVLVACSDNNDEAAQATNTEATEMQVATNAAMPTNKIEAGMTEQAVTDLLGTPALTQTHTLDSMTITHSEWTNETGSTSVQFINRMVTFSQFTPTNK
jgi:outer membrane biosynthesis protein TonB